MLLKDKIHPVATSATLNEDSQSILEQAIVTSQQLLSEFAESDNLLEKVTSIFGSNFDTEKLNYFRQSWLNGDFEQLPEIEIRSQEDLDGANGAFAASTNKIYLSEEYISQNSLNSGAIVDVLLEEIGHFVDANINQFDTAGDEGEIFSAVVQGVELNETIIQSLKNQDDTAIIVLDGEVIQVEQAEPTFDINKILNGLKSVFENIQENVLNKIYQGENIGNIPDFVDGLLFFGTDFAQKAKGSGKFLDEIYNKVKENFSGNNAVTKPEIQNALFQALGNILQDFNNDGDISRNDIQIDDSSGNLTINTKLRGTKKLTDISLPENIGLPQLGLNFTGNPSLTTDLDYSFNLGFGINQDNDFFLSTSSGNELEIALKPNLPKTSATFGFLKVDAEDKGTELNFGINLDDGNDGKLTVNELSNLNFTPTGSANINLGFRSDIPGAILPDIGADLNIQWQFTEGAIPTIKFDNTTIFLDSSLTKFLKPIVNPIQKITEPIGKATSFLTDEIEILKKLNLGGEGHNLLGLARQFNNPIGNSNSNADDVEKALKTIETIDKLSQVINNIDASSSENVGINLGTVNLGNFDLTSQTSFIKEAELPNFSELASISEFEKQLKEILEEAELGKDIYSGIDTFKEIGFSFPIYENPQSAIGLLIGKDVDLFNFDVDFEVSANVEGFISIPGVPILKVTFGEGEIVGKLNLGFNFDSNGIQQWAEGGFQGNDIGKIFDGFYVDDNRSENGEDSSELSIEGKLEAGPGFDAKFAAAKVTGGIEANVNIDLEDQGESIDDLGESDGRIRPSEFKTILESSNFGCLFDIKGQIDAFLGYYARVGWPPFGKKWEGDFARTTLADIGIKPCPDKQPILANEGPDNFTGGTLDLNIGPRAEKRLFIDTDDNDEVFVLKGTGKINDEKITVTALGYSQDYLGVNKIIANAGDFDDSIYVENTAFDVQFSGGNGNDVLYGGSGNDIINGDAGDDFIYGSEINNPLSGNDTLSGGSGDDVVVGRQGNDSIFGNEGNDNLLGDEGADIIDGGIGDDYLDGGTGNDKLYGDTDDSQVGNDIIFADEGDDELYGLAGDDILAGGNGSDSLYGASGNDQLLGDLEDNENGKDFLQGGSGNDSIAGGKGIDTVSYKTSINGTIVNIDIEKDYVSSEEEPNFTIDAAQAKDGFGTTDSFQFSITVNTDTYDESLDQFVSLTRNISGELENIIGSEYDDVLIGNSQENDIQALKGNDLLIGNAGNDILDGADDIDTVSYLRDPSSVIVNIDEELNYSNPGGFLHETIVSENPIPTDTEPNFTINPGTAKDGFGTTDTLKNLENIIGSQFDDVLIGNNQNNRIQAADGSDVLIGNAGNDILEGGNGSDTVSYRRDPNAVKVSLEDNFAEDGFGGKDNLSSIENVIGSEFNDTVIGDANDNTIFAGSGNDTVEARNGNDIIFGNDGLDSLQGEQGNDFLVGGRDADILDGGEGNDTASYFTSENRVSVSLTTGEGWFGDAKGDKLTAIENLEGSEFEDLLIGDNQNNIISGLGGNDLLKAEAGDDLLDGGEGSDRLLAGDGQDTLFGQAGDDLLKAGNGNDLLDGGEGNDQLYGEAGDDSLEGNSGNDYLEGGEGNDSLLGNIGNDQLYGQLGQDTLLGGSGDDLLDGGEDNDLLQGGEDEDQLYGQAGNDTLEGNAGDDLLEGGENNDLLQGGEDNDKLYGQAGEDNLAGNSGNDLLDGGENKDILDGGSGNDQLYGQQGEDTLLGGEGKDNLYGGTENDILQGQAGDDYLEGEDGDDQLSGGEDNDRLYGQQGNDFITGDTGDDYLDGGTDEDELYGNEGNDRIYGRQGFDYLDGGTGADFLDGGEDDDFIYGEDGSDRLYGGAGLDYLDGGNDDDRLEGGDGDDQLLGQQGRDYLDGGSGEDFLWGGEGNDQLLGNSGNDQLYGEVGDDDLDGGEGNDYLEGGAGQDTLDGNSGNDQLYGGDGDDSLSGSNGNDFLYGEAGEDTLDGGKGNDNLKGGDGKDSLIGGDGKDNLYGENGDDILDSGEGDDLLEGGDGNDLLIAGNGNNQIYGGSGNDILDAGSGNDYLEGGEGDDQITGGDGSDQLYGGSGNDTLDAGAGNDRLEGEEGADILEGFAGDDYIIGGNGNDKLVGGEGNDYLFGNEGDDELYAVAGDNVLNGGTGNNSLYGGSGIDLFVLAPDSGINTIYDFVVGKDYFGLADGLSFEQLTITQGSDSNADNTLISIADNQVIATLVGVQADTLSFWDFNMM
jgi:Ca2+-binding RTX toxin-like protein